MVITAISDLHGQIDTLEDIIQNLIYYVSVVI